MRAFYQGLGNGFILYTNCYGGQDRHDPFELWLHGWSQYIDGQIGFSIASQHSEAVYEPWRPMYNPQL